MRFPQSTITGESSGIVLVLFFAGGIPEDPSIVVGKNVVNLGGRSWNFLPFFHS